MRIGALPSAACFLCLCNHQIVTLRNTIDLHLHPLHAHPVITLAGVLQQSNAQKASHHCVVRGSSLPPIKNKPA